MPPFMPAGGRRRCPQLGPGARDGERPDRVTADSITPVAEPGPGHGFITLEMAGHFDSFNSPVNEVLLPLSRNVMVGMGESAQRATTSGLRAFKTCGKLSE